MKYQALEGTYYNLRRVLEKVGNVQGDAVAAYSFTGTNSRASEGSREDLLVSKGSRVRRTSNHKQKHAKRRLSHLGQRSST